MVAKKHGLLTGGETTVALSDLTKAAIDKLPPSRTPPAHFLPLLEKPRTFHSLQDAMRTMKVARR
jgi:hypothetical protein